MELDSALILRLISRDLPDLMIRVGLIVFMAVVCVRIFAPFSSLFLRDITRSPSKYF
jgi:hypothetical protein